MSGIAICDAVVSHTGTFVVLGWDVCKRGWAVRVIRIGCGIDAVVLTVRSVDCRGNDGLLRRQHPIFSTRLPSGGVLELLLECNGAAVETDIAMK